MKIVMWTAVTWLVAVVLLFLAGEIAFGVYAKQWATECNERGGFYIDRRCQILKAPPAVTAEGKDG